MLIAQKTNQGYSYTLATYALRFLHEAEQLFGFKNDNYPFGGVEVANSATPGVWYPEIGNRKYVVAQVTSSALTDSRNAIFQLSHEIIHVLSPGGESKTNNLEEGLASWFSVLMTEKYAYDRSYADRSIASGKYSYPYKLVTDLLLHRSDAIQRLREVQPILGLVKASDFIDAGLTDIPNGLIDEVVKPMKY